MFKLKSWVQNPLYLAMSAVALSCSGVLIQSTYAANQPESDPIHSDADHVLPAITVYSENDSATEKTGSYKAKKSRSSTGLNLNLKETPQSISVVTRAQIEERNLNIIDDVLQATPGVVIGKNDSERSNYYARGYGIARTQIDGMPIGESSPRTDSFFFDRIEVIKGASGLLGTTGDPSATINMVRKRPAKEFSGNASTSFGTWNTLRTEADVSIPLTTDGRVRSRIMGMHRSGDSYMDYYSLQSTAAMAMLEADITDRLVTSVGFQYQDNQPRGSTWGAVPYWMADGSLANLPRHFSLANKWNTVSESDRTAFADFSYSFDNDWLLKGSVSHSLSKNFWLMSYGGAGLPKADGTGIGLWNTVYPTTESKKTSAEIYLTGAFKLFGQEHQLIIGANGFDRSSEDISGTFIGNFGPQVTCKNSCVINNWQTWNGGATGKPTYTVDSKGQDSKQRNYGAYSTLRLSITEPLKLILGGRYSDYKATNGDQKDVSLTEFTPFAGVTYDINDLLTAYASYTDMFNPSDNKDRNSNYLEPETGKSYELGLKAGLLNDQLLLTTALFESKKENVAIADVAAIAQGIKTNDGGDPMIASGEGLTVRGFEFEAVGKVTPDLNLTFGYTYIDSKSSDIVKASTALPRNLIKIYGSYQFPNALFAGADKLSVGAGVTWQSDIKRKWRSGYPSNTDGFVRQDAYAVASANLGYKFNEYLSANLSVNNLFDEKYYQNVGFYNGVYWGEPRNTTLTLRARF